MESLIAELYAAHTAPERRVSIEAELRAWEASPGAWRRALAELDRCSNEAALLYFLSSLERASPRLAGGDALELGAELRARYRALADAAPAFFRNKLAALVATYAPPSASLFDEVLSLGAPKGFVLLRARVERCAAGAPGAPLLADAFAALAHGLAESAPREGALACLDGLQHLLAHGPRALRAPPPLVRAAFRLASREDADVAVAALGAVNELLYRGHAHCDDAELVACLRAEALAFARRVADADSPARRSEPYADKAAEFLRLFVAAHFERLEADARADAVALLRAMLQFTLHAPTCSAFVNALDAWSTFTDRPKSTRSDKYFEVLSELAGGTLNRIQFLYDGDRLGRLDRESTNDDGETEWQTYLRRCIETIARTAEFSPINFFDTIQHLWRGLAVSYDNRTTSEFEMYDLASFTQLLGRLAPTLFLDKEESSADLGTMRAVSFLEKLMKLLQSANDAYASLASRPSPNAHVIVYAEVLACMGSWSYYMSRCSISSDAVAFLLQIGSSLLVDKNETERAPVLCHAAAHMILSVVVCLKPTDPLHHSADLYAQAQRNLSHLRPKTADVVRRALCTMILECPLEMTDSAQNVEAERLRACASLVEAWCARLLALNEILDECFSCLPALTHLLNYFVDHPSSTKKILAASVERPVRVAMAVYENVYLHDHVVDGENANIAPLILELFLALIKTLHQQLGSAFVRNSIHLFLEVAKRKEQEALLQLLRVLQAGVECGGLINAAALDEVLSMCLENVLPLTKAAEYDADIEMALFELFGSILLNRWQHFYSSCVRQGWSPVDPDGSIDGAKSGQLLQFRAIMLAIAKTFLSDSIEVVRLNLRTLDFLNIRYKLYSKVVFRQELLAHYLEILLGILVHKTAVGTLLQEEVCTTVYNLAAVDFGTYFDSFVPTFLMSLLKIEPDKVREFFVISKDTDLPTFHQNTLMMMHNIRSYPLLKQSR